MTLLEFLDKNMGVIVFSLIMFFFIGLPILADTVVDIVRNLRK